jgi:hypothetical protein
VGLFLFNTKYVTTVNGRTKMQDENTTQNAETTETEQAKPETTEEKTFSQADVDRLISERIKRERRNYAQELENEKKKAAMDESERLKLEKEQAETRAIEATTKANQRIINAEAKAIAASAGVKADKLPYLNKLVDLSNVEIDENGNPDTSTIKAAIDGVLKDFPELVGTQGTSRAGADFSGQNMNPNPEDLPMEQYAEWVRTRNKHK